ncbi:MAG: DUF4956 domain-containing protein [Bacilli bacterium]|nr:DUF4956 domain-containing protein [Bacilli bacterium]
MFDSIYSSPATVGQMFLMLAVAIATGLATSFIMSLRMRSSPRFFIVTSLIPAVVGLITALTSDGAISTAAAVSVAGAFALVRFRSAQGNSEEIIGVLIAMGIGLACGAGYVAYAAIFGIGAGILYVLISMLPIFEHKVGNEIKLLRITVPEDLNYTEALEESFKNFTSQHYLIKVKTTNMGSLFKLNYRIKMKNPSEEKEFIDELRVKNGNLEIMIEPYAEYDSGL